MRLLNRHVQHVRNVFVLVCDFKRFPVISFAMTDVTGNVHVWQEVHFNLDDAITLTGFTATAFDIERKTASRITPFTCRGTPANRSRIGVNSPV